ncbi:hypothetical protein JOC77_000243 [Peribacillus deserti]|uniref:Uncharacterized protein n=1 Tax=Peribacillus deserti TaxID=673318 RepID=A0ABS2QCT4_9BACI|nr:hypothetical protein [Peribacillus deserti]MBM7690840.1 hypothetical protein [Peribacillus deserti]
MSNISSVKINGENIHLFASDLYIRQENGYETLCLQIVMGEEDQESNSLLKDAVVKITLDDQRVFTKIMKIEKVGYYHLPGLLLAGKIENFHEFEGIDIISENESLRTRMDKEITLDDIRKVKMPHDDDEFRLPVEQLEWLSEFGAEEKNEIVKRAIYDYMEKYA